MRFHILPALLLTTLVVPPAAVAQDSIGARAPDSTGCVIGHVSDDSTGLLQVRHIRDGLTFGDAESFR